MNIETKIRTIVAFLVALNTVLMSFGITAFSNVTEEVIYQVVSVIALIVSWFASHYYNNDYTQEACEGTGYTRLLKAMKKGLTFEDSLENDLIEEEVDIEGIEEVEEE